MRLINADELKQKIKVIRSVGGGELRYITEMDIDNAPTVTPSLNLDNITEDDVEKFKMIWQRATSKGLLVTIEARPQGEWIDQSEDFGYVECPFCGNLTTCHDNKDELHYCWHCGAEMLSEAVSEHPTKTSDDAKKIADAAYDRIMRGDLTGGFPANTRRRNA